MLFRPLAILGMVVALTACADMRGLAPQAVLGDANKLAAAETLQGVAVADWPASRWWTDFADPQLDVLMAEAIAANPSLKIAEARVEKARAQAEGTQSALSPRVNGNLSMMEELFSEHDLYPPPYAGTWNSQNRAALDFGYEFDFWGKNRAALDGALGKVKAAEVDAQAARLMVSVAIAHNYVGLQRAFAQRDIAEAVLKQRAHIHELTAQRFAAGLDSRVELKQAETAIPAIREQLSAIDESIALGRNQLAALLGQGPDRGRSITRPRIEPRPGVTLPSHLPAELVGRRPDIVAQRWRVEAQEKDIDVAKAQFYPDISLTAFIGLQSIGVSEFLKSASGTAGVGPALSLPLFDGGRRRSNLQARDADYDIAVEQYNQTLVDALHEVVDQLSSFRSMAEQRRQQRLALLRTQESYDLSLQRYREGMINYLQVLAAEAQLLAQKSRAADLDARELDLSINLIRALGGGYDGDTNSAAIQP